MEARLSFDQNVADYDQYRPEYCKALFQDIIDTAAITDKSVLLEIGAGTGLATGPFIRTGAKITAVEPGQNMSAYLSEKFRQNDNLRVVNCNFEDYNCEHEHYDVIYSATAFHWIPQLTGYTKAYDLLKPGGTLALFWNRPTPAREDYSLHCAIQEVYSKYMPSGNRPPDDKSKLYESIKETISEYGFKNVQLKLYHRERTFTAEEYIRLLNTYSDHIMMDHDARKSLEKGIMKAIRRHGNRFKLQDTIDLYLATK